MTYTKQSDYVEPTPRVNDDGSEELAVLVLVPPGGEASDDEVRDAAKNAMWDSLRVHKAYPIANIVFAGSTTVAVLPDGTQLEMEQQMARFTTQAVRANKND